MGQLIQFGNTEISKRTEIQNGLYDTFRRELSGRNSDHTNQECPKKPVLAHLGYACHINV